MVNSKTFRGLALILTASLAMACCQDKGSKVALLTEALDDSAWQQSQWISAVDAPVVTGLVATDSNNRAADGASWFVAEVQNEGKVVAARWMTTGLGVYELYINGNPVGSEILKPGFTHWGKTKRSFTYDVTGLINAKKGAVNQLSAQLTPGWWADKIITPNNHEGGMIGKKCAFRAVLELSYADGSTKLFGTDTENWVAGIAGPVKHADIFDGEEYDARELPGYACAEKLSKPELNDEFHGEILPTNGAEIYLREDITLKPVKAYTWKDIKGIRDGEQGTVVINKEYADGEEMTIGAGETLVVDFGQNAAAVPAFEFSAAEGTTLTCLPAELLNDGNGALSRGMDGPEGSVHRLNLRVPDSGMILKYTFAAAPGYVSYYPHCTFFGYRYVSITADAEVKIKSIRSIPVSSITEEMETGTLVTGNELVNKIISNTLWGQRSNYLSVPTDCPQRNERLGWTADTQVFAETGSFFANTDSFFHKWTRDLRDTQNEKGAFPGVAPLAQYGATWKEFMRFGWADAGVIVPWTVWKQFGDTDIISENWDAMVRFMNHVAEHKYQTEGYLTENGNYQWADWLSYEPLESRGLSAFKVAANGDRTPLPDAVKYWNYLGACYWLMDARMMVDMAGVCGKDASTYTAMADEAFAYIKSSFLNADGTFKTPILNTMQTPALFALKCGIVDGKAKEDMIARLRENFRQHDNCLQTGFLGTSILMSTLTDNGMADIAYELLLQHKNPSWLYSIDNGATTIWERWNSYTLEHGMGPKEMNSFNHYAYGCVCEWIWETAAGISSDASVPGFKHIVMKPVPDKRLGSIKAEYKSAAGLIKSEWKYEGDKWIWDFTIPAGATASVTLPGSDSAEEYGAGSHHVEI